MKLPTNTLHTDSGYYTIHSILIQNATILWDGKLFVGEDYTDYLREAYPTGGNR